MLGLYGLRSLDSGSVIGLISAQHTESGLSDAAGIAISVEWLNPCALSLCRKYIPSNLTLYILQY